jgi:hypothetical protein
LNEATKLRSEEEKQDAICSLLSNYTCKFNFWFVAAPRYHQIMSGVIPGRDEVANLRFASARRGIWRTWIEIPGCIQVGVADLDIKEPNSGKPEFGRAPRND